MARFDAPRLLNRVREYRKILNMSQYELAAASGVERVTIARLDAYPAAMPSLPTALRLAKAFGIPVQELVEKA